MKRRKFQEGGITEDVRARALRYASMAGSGTEETDAQKEFMRKRRAEDDMSALIRDAQARDRARQAISPPMKDVIEKSRGAAARAQETDEYVDRGRRAGGADAEEAQRILRRQPLTAGVFDDEEAQRMMRRRPMTEGAPPRRYADVPDMTPTETGQQSFGSRVKNALTQGGAGDIQNIMTAIAPGIAKAAKAFQSSKETIKKGREAAKDVRKRMQDTTSRRRGEDIERMEGEAPARVSPRSAPPKREAPPAPPKREPPPPQDFDEIRMAGEGMGFKKGGKTKKYAQGGSVSARADGIAKRGRTKCKVY